MKWNRYTIETTTQAEDLVSGMLMELGFDGVEIEDNLLLEDGLPADMYDELRPDLPPDDGTSRISFYIEEDNEDHSEQLMQVKTELEKMRSYVEIGSGRITTSETEDLDWINNWKQFFKSFYIDDILIKPTWEELKEEDKDKFLIEIDPGISFGTGKHETTQLCIRQLHKYIPLVTERLGRAPKLLDLGCGSGILSIAALKLGASEAVGTDIDEACLRAVAENFETNHLDPALGKFYIGDLTGDKEIQDLVGYETYDLVAANLLADIIIMMAPVIPQTMKKGAYLITSGIIDFKEEAVTKALTDVGLTIVEVNHQGDWINITAQK